MDIPDVKVELLYHRLESSQENTFDVGLSIPLPLFSYGGSSLIGFTILLGILVRLDAERLSQLR